MKQVHPDVVEADDGTLFLSRGQHNVFENATRPGAVDKTIRERIVSQIDTRAITSEKHGALYRHVIFPDKQTVLAHLLPDIQIKGLGEDIYRSGESPTIIYLRDALQRTDGRGDVFLKYDTHMSDIGNCTATIAILEDIYPGSGQLLLNRFARCAIRHVPYVGDLEAKVNCSLGGVKPVVMPDWPLTVVNNGYAAGNDGIMDVLISSEAESRKRLVLFGDSFGRGCLIFLSAYFHQILFVRSRYYHEEIVAQVCPDVVITESVERYLVNPPDDRDRPSAILYPMLGGHPFSPSTTFLRLLDAMLAYKHDPDRLTRVFKNLLNTSST